MTRRKTKAVVIFNGMSGDAAQSDAQLDQIRGAMDENGVTAEVVKVEPDLSIPDLARRAAQDGAHYVVASGGDNTIDMVARGLVGTRTRLVIVPTGTRNNIARALDIPTDVHAAACLISAGKASRVDMGRVRVAEHDLYFLELLTIGLTAALFPAMDAAQKGNLGGIGELLSTFISHPASTFSLNLDRGRQKLDLQALTLLVLNMPYLGANFQIASSVDYCDGLLDVFLYADLGKLELLTYALQVAQGFTDDPRVRHLRIKQLTVETDPPLPVMVDGQVLEARRILVSRAPRALTVMVPRAGASNA